MLPKDFSVEEKVAHYSLESMRRLISNKQYVVTLSARQSYTALGLNDDEMLAVIEKLTPRHLYKSMTSHANHKLWHDVYHSKFEEVELYIKLQVNDNVIIISFKEK